MYTDVQRSNTSIYQTGRCAALNNAVLNIQMRTMVHVYHGSHHYSRARQYMLTIVV